MEHVSDIIASSEGNEGPQDIEKILVFGQTDNAESLRDGKGDGRHPAQCESCPCNRVEP